MIRYNVPKIVFLTLLYFTISKSAQESLCIFCNGIFNSGFILLNDSKLTDDTTNGQLSIKNNKKDTCSFCISTVFNASISSLELFDSLIITIEGTPNEKIAITDGLDTRPTIASDNRLYKYSFVRKKPFAHDNKNRLVIAKIQMKPTEKIFITSIYLK